MNSHALFSPPVQKILALLFVRVDEAFYLNEIIRLTGLGSATVQRELQRLDTAGLILPKRVGNLAFFKPTTIIPCMPSCTVSCRNPLD